MINLVAGCKPWNRRIFDDVIAKIPGQWFYVDSPRDLKSAVTYRPALSYIFFLHWSWTVPAEIVRDYECVGFHMTDLPYGRGGSPLQNLIARGLTFTQLTAFRLTEELDTGPVYDKLMMSLAGGAEEIYIRATRISAMMIRQIVMQQMDPRPQVGKPVYFTRRKPHESRIGTQAGLSALHDFIRMLDAEGYPHAFVEHDGYRFEFTRSALYDGRVEADVRITAT